MINLKYYKLNLEVRDPFFATSNSACFDLCVHLTEYTPVKVYDAKSS